MRPVEEGRPLRIGVGAQILGKGKGGVETFVEAVIAALQEIDRENRYFIYVGPSYRPSATAPPPSNFTYRKLPSRNPWIERPLLIPRLYRRDRLDIVFLQRALPPLGCPRAVLHLHDAMYATHPELFPRWKALLYNAAFRRSVRRAVRVVTPSAAAKADIVRCYGADPDRVAVLPNAVDPRAFHPPRDEAALERELTRLGVRRPYVVCLGAVERNKNVALLVEAFQRFRRGFPDHRLVIVGQARTETKGGYFEEVSGLARRLGLEDEVVFTGYVDARARTALLGAAAMLVFPSTAEGFGLPPLEAMACGVPAAAARIPAVEEVCGDAALLTEPNNVEDLAAAMSRIAGDRKLRRELIERGRRRAGQFSWRRTAETLLDIFETACGRPSRESVSYVSSVGV